MNKYWQQLTSQERRVLAVIGLVIFILLNLLFIKPHFHDVALAEARKQKAEETLRLYQKELGKRTSYQSQINHLLEGAQADVEFEDQSQKFVTGYTERANMAGVIIVNGGGRPHFSTNEFFLEQDIGISTQSTESQLVNFLYSLGSGNSLMRVKNMNLRPDQSHQQLVATLSLVASYQKKAPAKTVGPPKTPNLPAGEKAAAKPATPAVKPVPGANAAGSKTNKAPTANPTLPPVTNKPSALGARPTNTNRPPPANVKKP